MNRHRSEQTTHISVFITLILAAIGTVVGGLLHVKAKNEQIQVERQIDQANARIGQTQMKIRMIGVRNDKYLDRYVLKQSLADVRSSLVAATPADIVMVPRPSRLPDTGPQVASASENTP